MSIDPLQHTYQQALETLAQKLSQLHRQYASHMQCKKGCAGCCISGFKIRYIDALQLIAGYAQLPTETAAKIVENLQTPSRMVCPLLVDGACSLYAQRPLLCRAYGVVIQLGDKVATCDLNFQNLSDQEPIHTLDLAPYYDLLDELSNRAWQAYPLPALTPDAQPSEEAPRVSIQTLFQAVLSLQGPSSVQQPAALPNPNVAPIMEVA